MIKILFELVTTSGLEPWIVGRLASQLVSLLKKRDLVTSEDLQLPWRPLYDLYERLMYSPYEALGMVQYPT